VTAVKPVIPAVAVAVNVITSAFEYTGVEIVILVPAVVIIPVKVPLKEPEPVATLKVMVVLLVGLVGVPLASCDCTVTLKAVPAVPVEGTTVYANLVAVAAAVEVVTVIYPVDASKYVVLMLLAPDPVPPHVPFVRPVPPRVSVPTLMFKPFPMLAVAVPVVAILKLPVTEVPDAMDLAKLPSKTKLLYVPVDTV
jgi:hypothetical protein